MFRNISSSKLWLDQRPPESLREIYNSCLLRLKEIKTNLDQLDFKYSIDEANRFKTFSNLSLRLNRIRQLAGIANLKNQKSILEVIKIVNYNIKKNNEEQLRTIQKETLNRQISIESDNESTQSDSKDSDDDYSDDEHLKQDLKTFFNFSNKISKVIREKQEEARINEFLNIDKKKYDNLISPLLNSIKRNFIQIDQESLVDLDCLINIQDLTLQAINTEYSQIIELIEQINSLCDKYLLSFYEKTIEDLSILDKEPQLEHSKKLLKNFEQILKYDQKKNSIFKTIKKNLHNLKNLYLLFSEENSNGILSKNLSDFSKNLSKRFDLDDVQVVLLIPEFSYLLNDCIILLREWINYDSQYSGLIENDMKIFDRKKRDLLDDKIFFDRIYKKLYRRIDLLRTELIETSQKFKAVLTLDVEIEEKRISSVDMRLYFDKIELNLNEIESEMNKLNRMGLVEAKKRSLLKQKLDYFEKDMNLFYIENKVKQIDVEILETSYFKLKNVLIYKSLNETVEKIYYNIELPQFKFGLQNSIIDSNVDNSDHFDNILHLVSIKIGKDWIKLYNILPFYPKRGLETLKKDIENIYMKFYRGNCESEQALSSFLKWKRVNARAKIKDVEDGLKKIGRFDILKEVMEYEKKVESLRNESRNPINKKSSFDDEDLKKQEAEILHQKLTKFFDSKNIKTKQFDFKFSSKELAQV